MKQSEYDAWVEEKLEECRWDEFMNERRDARNEEGRVPEDTDRLTHKENTMEQYRPSTGRMR